MRAVLIGFCLTLVSVSAVSADLIRLSAEERAALRVETIRVNALPPLSVDAIDGIVTMPAAARQAVVSPFAGVIQQTFVTAGETVTEGQPLVRILSRELLDAAAESQRAEAELVVARQAADRDAHLLEEGIIAAARADASQARLRQAQAQAARGTAMLRGVHAGQQPGEYFLRAADAGRVSMIHGDVGAAVGAMAVVALVDAGDERWIDGQIPLQLLALIRPGDTAVIHPVAAEGRVLAVGAGVVPGTQAVTLRVAAQSAALMPGAAVRIEVRPVVPAGSIVVPAAALSRTANGTQVFVDAGTGFLPTPVEVIGEAGLQAVLRATLPADAAIAVRGVSALSAIRGQAD